MLNTRNLRVSQIAPLFDQLHTQVKLDYGQLLVFCSTQSKEQRECFHSNLELDRWSETHTHVTVTIQLDIHIPYAVVTQTYLQEAALRKLRRLRNLS